MRLEDGILIEKPARHIYQLISDVEGHVKILPGYQESRIVSAGPPCILLRQAIINGRQRRWKSEVHFDNGKAVRFKQIEGPLAGMRVTWELSPKGNGTWLA